MKDELLTPIVKVEVTGAVTRREFEQVLDELAQNTRITTEVREILATFNILFRVAKWTAAIAACGTAIIAFVRALKGGF